MLTNLRDCNLVPEKCKTCIIFSNEMKILLAKNNMHIVVTIFRVLFILLVCRTSQTIFTRQLHNQGKFRTTIDFQLFIRHAFLLLSRVLIIEIFLSNMQLKRVKKI